MFNRQKQQQQQRGETKKSSQGGNGRWRNNIIISYTKTVDYSELKNDGCICEQRETTPNRYEWKQIIRVFSSLSLQ